MQCFVHLSYQRIFIVITLANVSTGSSASKPQDVSLLPDIPAVRDGRGSSTSHAHLRDAPPHSSSSSSSDHFPNKSRRGAGDQRARRVHPSTTRSGISGGDSPRPRPHQPEIGPGAEDGRQRAHRGGGRFLGGFGLFGNFRLLSLFEVQQSSLDFAARTPGRNTTR